MSHVYTVPLDSKISLSLMLCRVDSKCIKETALPAPHPIVYIWNVHTLKFVAAIECL